MDQRGEIYALGAWIVGAIIFFRAYNYFLKKHGTALGLALGLLPSALVAFIGAVAWPLVTIAYFVKRG